MHSLERLADGPVQARKARYAELVDRYYDLTTDLAEYGWGDSFHFGLRYRGDTRRESLLRYQHHLAARLELRPGMQVLDAGCGLGGPMRNIARLVDVQITGVTINAYQVDRGRLLTARAGLADRCRHVVGDFIALDFDDATFDRAFTIEAACHAPDRRDVFTEIFRVLRPGALFAGYEWCLTDRYDPADREHVRLKRAIEEAHALPDLRHTSTVAQALAASGFDVLETFDMAERSSPDRPWYRPLTALEGGLRGLHSTATGKATASALVAMLERVGFLARGSRDVVDMMARGGGALAASGRCGIFTPSYFFLARRP